MFDENECEIHAKINYDYKEICHKNQNNEFKFTLM